MLQLFCATQMEKYAQGRDVILGIIKAHHNIVKIRPSNGNCVYCNGASDQYKGAIIANL